MVARSPQMTALVVSPHPPTAPLAGGRRRILEFLRALRQNTDIDLVCFSRTEADVILLHRLNTRGFRVHSIHRPHTENNLRGDLGRPALLESFKSEKMMRRVTELLTSRQYDWVVAERCFAAGYVELASCNRMLSEHNIEYRLVEQLACPDDYLNQAFALAGPGASPLQWASDDLAEIRAFEERSWRSADLCVCVSETDRKVIMSVASSTETHVAPNCPSYKLGGVNLRRAPPNLVFIGALNYLPNVDAIVYMVEKILPMIRRRVPGIEVVVAGSSASESLVAYCARNRISIVVNPEKITDILTSNSIMLCPIRLGAGTRIKVLDAIALGIPIVATSIALEGISLTPGMAVLVEDDPYDFAFAVVRVLNSEYLRARLVLNSKRYLRESGLEWGKVFKKLVDRLEEKI